MRSIHASVGERRDLVNGLAMSRGVFSTECLTCTSWVIYVSFVWRTGCHILDGSVGPTKIILMPMLSKASSDFAKDTSENFPLAHDYTEFREPHDY